MAARRSTRVQIPVRRLGFDESSDEDVDAADESVIQQDSDQSSSEEEDAPVGPAAAWQFVLSGADNGPSDVIFSGIPGMQNGIDTADWTLIDYIKHFLPDNLFECITRWTNSCILIKRSEVFLAGEDVPDWKEVSCQEMKTVVGLLFLMGIIQKPSLHSYWETNSMMSTPYFGQCMGRDRFLFILCHLRFSDPYDVDKAVKSTRLQHFFEEVFNICSTFVSDQQLSLDESLLLFKGRLLFKMFIRIKRARFGIKIFYLCDPHGYTICSHVYYGAATDLQVEEPGTNGLSKSEKIVVFLLSKAYLLDKGYVVNVDNWYNSLRLAEYLLTRNTRIRGTIRSNRGIPPELVSKPLVAPSAAYMRKGDVLAVKFTDKKDVYVLSTIDAADEVVKERVLPGNVRMNINKPTAIDRYNHEMGGVDVADQYVSHYDITRKTQAWFKKVGLNGIQRLLLNAHIRYRCEKNPNARFLDCMKAAVAELTGKPAEPGDRAARVQPPPLAQPHSIRKIPDNKQRQCKMCYKRDKKRKDTRYECQNCAGNPAICVACFVEWHT